MRYVICLLFCTMPLFAQTAKVMPIEPADAAKAKQLYEAKLAAEKAWEDYQSETAQKYLTVPYGDPEASSYKSDSSDYLTTGTISTGCSTIGENCAMPEPSKEERSKEAAEQIKRDKQARYWITGWGDSVSSLRFDWSKDFKFIVPKEKPQPITAPYPNFSYPNCSNGVCY